MPGYPFEDSYGYARAIRIGDHFFVSGTTARPPTLEGDAYLSEAIATVAQALGEAGAGLRHVVKTVIYVLDMADARPVARTGTRHFAECPLCAKSGRSQEVRL